MADGTPCGLVQKHCLSRFVSSCTYLQERKHFAEEEEYAPASLRIDWRGEKKKKKKTLLQSLSASVSEITMVPVKWAG